MKHDLLGLKELSREQIQNILEEAADMKRVVLSREKKIHNLQ